jgi:hypothetical protein
VQQDATIQDIHNSYSFPSTIRIINSRWIRWSEHVERIARRGKHTGYCRESQKEKDQVELGWGGVEGIGLAQDMVQWKALVNAVLNLQVP